MSTLVKSLDTTDLVLAGAVTVDSGQIMIGDPCYLDEWQPWDSDSGIEFSEHEKRVGEYSYLGSCNATLSDVGYGTLGLGNAVSVSSGYGDGYYPVYVKINDEGRVVMAIIDFDSNLMPEED
jgi:hypothetical protein